MNKQQVIYTQFFLQILQIWFGNGKNGKRIFRRRPAGKCIHPIYEVYDVSLSMKPILLYTFDTKLVYKLKLAYSIYKSM